MPTYKRWRRGTVASKSNTPNLRDGEYRVGPVPPEDGITGYERAHVAKGAFGPGKLIPIHAKLAQLATPDPHDILNAVNKITTEFVYVSCYIVRPSGDIKKPTFRWIAKEHGPVKTSQLKSDMNRLIRGALPFKSMTEYSYALLSPKFQYPLVVAWNFLEA